MDYLNIIIENINQIGVFKETSQKFAITRTLST